MHLHFKEDGIVGRNQGHEQSSWNGNSSGMSIAVVPRQVYDNQKATILILFRNASSCYTVRQCIKI